MVMRIMVVPMLERRLEQLLMAARVAPTNVPIQLAIQEIASELGIAPARLDRMLDQ
jgi:hypothetical protein